MIKIYNDHKLLEEIDNSFLEFLSHNHVEMHDRLVDLRKQSSTSHSNRPDVNISNLSKDEYSEFIIAIAPYLEDFIAHKFAIEAENNSLKNATNSQNIIFEARRKFVERYAIIHYPPDSLDASSSNAGSSNEHFSSKQPLSNEKILSEISAILGNITQQNIAEHCIKWLQDKEQYRKELEITAQYCSLMVKMNSSLALFDIPRKIDPNNHVRSYRINQLTSKIKIGFDFRDSESSLELAQTHANYCLYCHKSNKDSCSTGMACSNEMTNAKSANNTLHTTNNNAMNTSNNDSKLKGCPLDQKISEMNLLRSQGYNIAALAIITIDNPLIAITGHRICNDCAKACIFQKQTPVNIPLIETNILESVLSLPYGIEIYYLLTQWNPLKITSYLPNNTYQQSIQHSVLVVGLGPAGIAASYYFCRQGHRVFAIDGLKILDYKAATSSNTSSAASLDILHKPIKNWTDINGKLSERIPCGFGGVAEYGITNRWNKNFLLLARIILERNSNFSYQGAVRLGSNLSIQQAFDYGFDHVSLCLGAGKPKYLHDAGFFLKGVKSSADFLMQLQQSAAYKKASASSLQIRLPAYVYGCGLTAIDSAVELLNYYPQMVKNFVEKYNAAKAASQLQTESQLQLSPEELEIAREYIEHAKMFEQCNNAQEIIDVIRSLGGVNIIYHKKLQNSPAYARNHEEIEHAIATGINFIEEQSIIKAIPDQYNSLTAIELAKDISAGKAITATLPARTLLLGLGTGHCEFTDIITDIEKWPNGSSQHSGSSRHSSSSWPNNSSQLSISAKLSNYNYPISYFGDCDPAYHGSVVKAIASVKDGYQSISQTIASQKPKGLQYENLIRDLKSTIITNNKISEKYAQLTISSPSAARNYKIGQFFRLQNMSADISHIMEPLVISPYKIDKSNGEISFVIANVGKSSSIATHLQVGQQVALMGPAGSAIDTKITSNKKEQTDIVIICQNIGSIISLPLARWLIDNGYIVHLLVDSSNFANANFTNELQDFTKQELNAFLLDISKQNHQSKKLHLHYLNSNSLEHMDNLNDVLSMMHKRRELNDAKLIFSYGHSYFEQQSEKYIGKYFQNGTQAVTMINVPMQCLMKGICGQCIQKTNDDSGYIFACDKNIQDIKNINFDSLKQRHKINALMEKFHS